MKLPSNKQELESAADIHSALGFDKLLAGKPSGTSPAVSKGNNTRNQAAPDDDKPVKSSSKPADFSENNKPSEDKDAIQTWMLISLMAHDKADEEGNISASNVTGFVKMLEAAGINTQPIKNIIEEVSGKPYAEFEASASSGGYVSAEGIVNHSRSGGRFSRDRGPLIHNGSFNSARALNIAASDAYGSGECGRGTFSVLSGMGYQVQRNHGKDWDETLSSSRNWVRLKVDPAHAPVGAVLTFDSDTERGKAARNKGGGLYGHVEVIAENASGQKVFVSDKARNNWGGSVPDNYAGAFLYVGPNAPAGNLQLAQQINGGGTRYAASGPSPNLG